MAISISGKRTRTQATQPERSPSAIAPAPTAPPGRADPPPPAPVRKPATPQQQHGSRTVTAWTESQRVKKELADVKRAKEKVQEAQSFLDQVMTTPAQAGGHREEPGLAAADTTVQAARQALKTAQTELRNERDELSQVVYEEWSHQRDAARAEVNKLREQVQTHTAEHVSWVKDIQQLDKRIAQSRDRRKELSTQLDTAAPEQQRVLRAQVHAEAIKLDRLQQRRSSYEAKDAEAIWKLNEAQHALDLAEQRADQLQPEGVTLGNVVDEAASLKKAATEYVRLGFDSALPRGGAVGKALPDPNSAIASFAARYEKAQEFLDARGMQGRLVAEVITADIATVGGTVVEHSELHLVLAPVDPNTGKTLNAEQREEWMRQLYQRPEHQLVRSKDNPLFLTRLSMGPAGRGAFEAVPAYAEPGGTRYQTREVELAWEVTPSQVKDAIKDVYRLPEGYAQGAVCHQATIAAARALGQPPERVAKLIAGVQFSRLAFGRTGWM